VIESSFPYSFFEFVSNVAVIVRMLQLWMCVCLCASLCVLLHLHLSMLFTVQCPSFNSSFFFFSFFFCHLC
jgi:hypothetical protein